MRHQDASSAFSGRVPYSNLCGRGIGAGGRSALRAAFGGGAEVVAAVGAPSGAAAAALVVVAEVVRAEPEERGDGSEEDEEIVGDLEFALSGVGEGSARGDGGAGRA